MFEDMPLLYQIAGVLGIGIMLLDALFLLYIFSADGMKAGREILDEGDEPQRVDLDKVVAGYFGGRR